jgi:hypothetical protein
MCFQCIQNYQLSWPRYVCYNPIQIIMKARANLMQRLSQLQLQFSTYLDICVTGSLWTIYQQRNLRLRGRPAKPPPTATKEHRNVTSLPTLYFITA